MNCRHQFEIVNLNEGEIVQQSIILVKGRVLTRCSLGIDRLDAELQQSEKEKETKSDRSKLIEPVCLSTQVSSAGEFKLLLDLEVGVKSSTSITFSLLLRYCCVEHAIQFTYKNRQSNYRVQPLYIVCRNTNSVEEASDIKVSEQLQIIDLNLRLVQSVYAEKLRAAGFVDCTFTLNDKCQVFNSQLNCSEARQLGEDELWQYFAEELLASAEWGKYFSNLKFVGFIGCTQYNGAAVVASGDYSYANIRHNLKAHAALGGGGLALFGSAFFYAWPSTFEQIDNCLRSTKRIDYAQYPDESNYRRTYGGVYASTLGAVCHELGHCFDLGHTIDGVMGNGLDYLNRVLIVETLTENLPNRIIQKGLLESTAQPPTTNCLRPKFTQLKLNHQPKKNSFLEKYHEQRKHDCFYFTHNCAVILAHHKWLRCENTSSNSVPSSNSVASIQFETETGTVVSNSSVKLIEARSKTDSVVVEFIELQQSDNEHDVELYRLLLPTSMRDLIAKQEHYIFVITTDGETKRLIM